MKIVILAITLFCLFFETSLSQSFHGTHESTEAISHSVIHIDDCHGGQNSADSHPPCHFCSSSCTHHMSSLFQKEIQLSSNGSKLLIRFHYIENYKEFNLIPFTPPPISLLV